MLYAAPGIWSVKLRPTKVAVARNLVSAPHALRIRLTSAPSLPFHPLLAHVVGKSPVSETPPFLSKLLMQAAAWAQSPE